MPPDGRFVGGRHYGTFAPVSTAAVTPVAVTAAVPLVTLVFAPAACAALHTTLLLHTTLFLAFALTPTARAALRTAQLLQRTPLCPEPCLCLASLDAPYLRQYYYYDDSARSDL